MDSNGREWKLLSGALFVALAFSVLSHRVTGKDFKLVCDEFRLFKELAVIDSSEAMRENRIIETECAKREPDAYEGD